MTVPGDLARVAASARLLVALDFDGTLATTVDEPMTARMLPAARRAVDALVGAPATTVALISGRALADLRVIAEHTDDSRILLAGSHGAEVWPYAGAGAPTPAEQTLRDELVAEARRIVQDTPGAWIEPKTFGFGVHTRLSAPAAGQSAHDSVDALMAASAPGWRRRKGHDLVEYAFRDTGKDGALARLRAQTRATAVVFAGDDVTDEDAMAALGPDDLGIRVGPGPSHARLRVADPAELAELLARLAEAREAARTTA